MFDKANIRKQVEQYQRERRGDPDPAKQVREKDLVLISGKVRTLEAKEGYKNFMGEGKGATQAAAIGAAASGALFNSAILGGAAMMKENVTYYRCKIGDYNLMGYFNYIGFKNGDEVEAVVELDKTDPNHGFVYALRKPKERRLWVIDRMVDGVNVTEEICRKFPKVLLVLLLPFSFLIMLITTLFQEGGLIFLQDNWLFLILTFAGSGIFLYFMLWMGYRLSFIPKARIANKIIQALGYNTPEEISLAEESELAKQRWQEKHGKPFPKDPGEGFTLHY